jgi:hypothetical protein
MSETIGWKTAPLYPASPSERSWITTRHFHNASAATRYTVWVHRRKFEEFGHLDKARLL